jgi:hypothetical protein
MKGDAQESIGGNKEIVDLLICESKTVAPETMHTTKKRPGMHSLVGPETEK